MFSPSTLMLPNVTCVGLPFAAVVIRLMRASRCGVCDPGGGREGHDWLLVWLAGVGRCPEPIPSKNMQ
jgi:hypothetical protein